MPPTRSAGAPGTMTAVHVPLVPRRQCMCPWYHDGSACEDESFSVACLNSLTHVGGCPWYHDGSACEDESFSVACLNDCSQRGGCEGGVCQCQAGFFGADCSLYYNEELRLRRKGNLFSPSPTPLSHPPPSPPTNQEAPRMQHSPYIDHPKALWFWERLLASRHRTIDPREADYFYVPLLIRSWERLLASRHRTIDPREADFFYMPLLIRNRDSGKQRLISETISFIRSLGPFWDAKGGADHIFLVSEEYGKCALQLYGLEDPRLASAITLTPWGYTCNMLGTPDGGPCFRPRQDIVIPPSAHLRHQQNASMVREAGGLPTLVREGGADGEGEVQQQGQEQQEEGNGGQGQGGRERQYLLFVRGLNVSDGSSTWDEEAHRQEQGGQRQGDNKEQQQVQARRKEQGKPPFSFGVRQRVFELYARRDGETGFKVEVVPDGGEELAYGGMEHSVFCLATAGHGWHALLAMAMIAGCVPVVIQVSVL
ncbi:unnamed protein product [Closterium sp. NIES-65]|nr:unnamed protein product [Closterium sp. NIES-65]